MQSIQMTSTKADSHHAKHMMTSSQQWRQDSTKVLNIVAEEVPGCTLSLGARCSAPLALEKLTFSVGSTARILAAADSGSCACTLVASSNTPDKLQTSEMQSNMQ